VSWSQHRRRSVCKTVTFTPEEWKEAEELWRKFREVNTDGRYQRFSDWARQLLMWGHVEQIVVAFDPVPLRRDIRAIGSNINQIAHVANGLNTVTGEQIREVSEQHERLWGLFKGMADEYAQLTGIGEE
jgi:hypothetical protein